MKIARLLFRRRHFSLTRFLEPQGRRTSAAGSSSRHLHPSPCVVPSKAICSIQTSHCISRKPPAIARASHLRSLCSEMRLAPQHLARIDCAHRVCNCENSPRSPEDHQRILPFPPPACLSTKMHLERGVSHVSFQGDRRAHVGTVGEQVRGHRYFPSSFRNPPCLSLSISISHIPLPLTHAKDARCSVM